MRRPSSKAKARVAHAEACLAQFDDPKAEQTGDADLLNRAHFALNESLTCCDRDSVMAVVAHLYEAKILIKRGHIHNARQKFYEGWQRRETQVQNGWVRQLAKEIEIEQPAAEVALDLDRLRDELMRAREDGLSPRVLWDEALHRLR